MELELVEEKPKKAPQAASKKKAVLKKLDTEVAKALQSLKDRMNKKTFGRKVRDSEIIGLGLSLVGPDHIKQIQNQTLTEKDRLQMAHEDYQKAYGKLTMDEFIGKLLNGDFQKSKNSQK